MVRRIIVGAAAALLLALGLPKCEVLPPQFGWIARADAQIAQGNYTAAEAIYQRTMNRTPSDATPALNLAALYATWGRPERGLSALEEAVARGADESLVIPLRLRLLAEAGAWNTLRIEARRRVSSTSRDENAWQALTLAALHLGDCAAATEAAIRWIESSTSTRAESRYYLAVLSASPGRLSGAAPALRRAAETCDADRPYCIGTALIRQERWALAVCPLRRAVRISPQNADAHVWLGEALSRNDLNAEAEIHLLEAVRLAPESPLPWLILGKHYLDTGETTSARNPLLNAQALDPSNPAPCLAIAELKAQAGAYEEMNIWADAALQRASNDVEVWKAVARLYLERHLIRDTYPRRAAEGAVDLNPKDGEAHRLLGWTHLQSNRRQAAIEALSRSVELTPDSGEAHFLLGQALKASGEIDRAQQTLRRAANLGYHSDP